ncbi:hypothetical protein RchiOBHm_Chr3g0461331 [Rosa chinensis]|uniref:Uncharacterized protein n=1 Tax=Rosa chinensis TaxID=74649 RepID=A0A2P6R8L3_ROSCH|nr:hypothetical protein RchiOBHm_Chr3g0461331 [Rosa chinensis]
MARFKDAISILVCVLFRKSTHLYREFAAFITDLVSVVSSTIQVSGFIFLHSTRDVSAGSSRHSPMYSSMFARHDH